MGGVLVILLIIGESLVFLGRDVRGFLVNGLINREGGVAGG